MSAARTDAATAHLVLDRLAAEASVAAAAGIVAALDGIGIGAAAGRLSGFAVASTTDVAAVAAELVRSADPRAEYPSDALAELVRIRWPVRAPDVGPV